MSRPLFAIVAACLIVISASRDTFAQGPLITVGGGGTTDEIVGRALELAGGREAVVAVLPQASSADDAGEDSVKMWRSAGAKDVRVVKFANRGAARRALEAATLIWIPGGDQNRFMKTIAGTGLDDVIRARHAAGVVVGGTSAGAAVVSKVMITGDADLQSLRSGSTRTAEGLGLWPAVIVDQHFLRRQRYNRLMSAVLDQPSLVGVGIDEATAVIARGTTLEVLGRSAAVIIDARGAEVAVKDAKKPVAAQDVKVTVAREGMTVTLR
jgi:cyanophycinase